jgi:hypothetical protein
MGGFSLLDSVIGNYSCCILGVVMLGKFETRAQYLFMNCPKLRSVTPSLYVNVT